MAADNHIRVDAEVYEFLDRRGRSSETFNTVLRRELGLDDSDLDETDAQTAD